MTTIMNCPLTRYRVKSGNIIFENDDEVKYRSQVLGIVKIKKSIVDKLATNDLNYLIAGIWLRLTDSEKESITINEDFISYGYRTFNPPSDFKSKCYETLKYLYNSIGKENRRITLDTSSQFPIGYSSVEEFGRIIDKLDQDYFIEYEERGRISGGRVMYLGFKMTNYGIEEAERTLPNIPMHSLVSQEIQTGDESLDEKINHAKKLFFSEPRSMQNMRSACETLAHILEPLRDDIKKVLQSQATNTFFQLVNSFDIRHNKNSTMKVEFPEQLEWIFYGLLNSINTYVKLKQKSRFDI